MHLCFPFVIYSICYCRDAPTFANSNEPSVVIIYLAISSTLSDIDSGGRVVIMDARTMHILRGELIIHI